MPRADWAGQGELPTARGPRFSRAGRGGTSTARLASHVHGRERRAPRGAPRRRHRRGPPPILVVNPEAKCRNVHRQWHCHSALVHHHRVRERFPRFSSSSNCFGPSPHSQRCHFFSMPFLLGRNGAASAHRARVVIRRHRHRQSSPSSSPSSSSCFSSSSPASSSPASSPASSSSNTSSRYFSGNSSHESSCSLSMNVSLATRNP